MPTIKTQVINGVTRIITKTVDGEARVSCECCAACCMYPADQLNTYLGYTEDDLPDNLTVNGSSLSRVGSTYGNTTNGVIFESGVWALYANGTRSTSNCLIRGDGNFTPGDDTVEDQFDSQYLVELGDSIGPSSFTVSRVGLCTWVWSETLGEFISVVDLYYNSVALQWEVTGGYFPDGTEGSQSLFITAFRYELATPVGSYDSDGGGYTTLNVSEITPP